MVFLVTSKTDAGDAVADRELTSGASLFTRENAPIVIAVVALVTLGAFENRAVLTAMPTVLIELNSVTSYGLVGAAPLATYLVALATAGWWADRRWHTEPWLTLVGVAMGLAAATIASASPVARSSSTSRASTIQSSRLRNRFMARSSEDGPASHGGCRRRVCGLTPR